MDILPDTLKQSLTVGTESLGWSQSALGLGQLDQNPFSLTPRSASASPNLVFIDANVADYQSLATEVSPGDRVYQLTATEDGISQISRVLAGYQDVAALQIVSHGSMGHVQLGNTDLSLDTLAGYTSQLQGWGRHLASGADVLIYGCNVALGETGNAFVQQLSQTIGADIAASNNLTGSAALGGDWVLEVQTGAIAVNLAFNAAAIATYGYTLATTITTTQINTIATGLDSFLTDLQSKLNSQVTNTRLPILGTGLQAATQFFDTTFRNPLKTNLDTVKADAAPTLEKVQQAIATALGGLLDGAITPTIVDGDNFTFNLNLKKALADSTTPITLDLGLPALQFDAGADLKLKTQVGYDFALKFGLNSGNFNVDTAAADELKVNFAVKADSLNASAKLGLLKLTVKDAVAAPTQLSAGLAIDLQGTSSSLNLKSGLLGGLNTNANINLDLATTFSSEFPSFKTTLAIAWGLNADFSIKQFDVNFKNTRISLDSLTNSFIKPIGDQINQILKPLQPVIDILNTKIPVLDKRIIDLIGSSAGAVSDFLDIYNALNTFSTIAATGEITLFNDLKLNDFLTGSLLDLSATQLKTANIGALTGSNALPAAFQSLADLGVKLPILTDPKQIFRLLIGDDTADLFSFDLNLPSFTTGASQSVQIWVVPPVFANVAGDISLGINLGFGYDAKGLARQFAGTGVIFDGFYLKDTSGLHLGLGVEASGGLGTDNPVFTAALAIGARLQADVKTKLQDVDADGKLRTYEINQRFAEGPLCLFGLEGKVNIGIFGEGKVGLGPFKKSIRKTLIDKDLLNFDTDECGGGNPTLPALATPLGDVLRLNMGRFAGDRNFGSKLDENEVFKVEHVSGVAGNETVRVTAFGFSHEYAGVRTIYAEGGQGNDTIELAPGVLADSQLWGDFNPANPYNGPAAVGSDGNDRLFAGNGQTELHGGGGDDYLNAEDAPGLGRTGAAFLYGEDGNDEMAGGSSDDFLYGGAGQDLLYGNGGNDVLFGDRRDGTSTDLSSVDATNASDFLNGGAGNDFLYGELGDDYIEGQDGNDTIEGGAGNDDIRGGRGNDTIIGGASTNIANDGNDIIDGEAGDDIILGDNGFVLPNGTVNLIGGSGNDTLFGGDGNDTLYGQGGNDTIVGQGGNDRLFGHEGDDFLSGGAGNDTLQGGLGNDVLFGEAGQVVALPGGGRRYESVNPELTGDDILNGNEGNDIAIGGAGNDQILGDVGADMALIGDNGRVTLNSSGVYVKIETTDAAFGGNDTITGSVNADIILGGSGDDTIFDGGGNAVDILLGDNGRVVGDSGDSEANDIISTDATFGGQDTIRGGGGDDIIIGGSGGTDAPGVGGDRIFGEAGNDILLGDSGRITRNATNQIEKIETLFATNGGDDTIDGGTGISHILGGFGNDTITGDSGNDFLLGDNGSLEYALDGNLATLDRIMATSTSGGNDTITGNAGEDIILGGAGNDTLSGNLGQDVILGDDGKITLSANIITRIETSEPNATGNDVINGNEDADVILGGTGNDTIAGGSDTAIDILLGDNGVVVRADGSAQANDIFSTDPDFGGRDTINGGGGNDIIIGGSGTGETTGGNVGAGGDTLNGNAGDDIIVGDGAYISRNSSDTIEKIATLFTNKGGDDTIDGGTGLSIVLGGFGNDRITADIGADILLGDNGSIDYTLDTDLTTLDRITAMSADGGDDTILGKSGDDVILGGAGNDTLAGDDGQDVILGDNGAITLVNNLITRISTSEATVGGNDVITGGNDADIVLGGTGNDMILGGDDSADDILLGDNGVVVRADGSDQANDIFSTEPTQGGTDEIHGGGGNDIIVGGSGGADTTGPGLNDGDRLFGDAGNDIVIGDNAYITRNSLNQVETIATLFPSNGGDDQIEGNEGSDRLIGGFGNDQIAGNSGDDIILGDNGLIDFTLDGNLTTIDRITTLAADAPFGGQDDITGDDGNDIILGGAAGDTIRGNAGNDILLGDYGTITGIISTTPLDDTLTSVITKIASIFPTIGGNDIIHGDQGDDRILGGAANDTITGDAGQDIILGDNGLLDYSLDGSFSTLDLIQTTDPNSGGNDTIAGNDGNDIALGGAANDNITGNAGEDILIGDHGQIIYQDGVIKTIATIDPGIGGNDIIAGNEGNDIILGGFADDLLNGNTGDDKILGDNGRLEFAFAGETLTDITLTPSQVVLPADHNLATLDFITTTDPILGGADTIFGGLGNDQILGGTGADTIYGDDGVDRLDASWTVISRGDFNADGKADVLWYNTSDRRTLIWLMDGTTVTSSLLLPTPTNDWKIAGAADFNGDNRQDLLWRNQVTGDVGVWLTNGTLTPDFGILAAGVPLNWQIANLADFNGDGKADILWTNPTTGQVGVWLINGKTIVATSELSANALLGWHIAGLGDFNADGKQDIAWRNQANGAVGIWLMNGLTFDAGLASAAVPSDWQIAGFGDFNGDGKTDLLWRTQDPNQSTVAVWLMAGKTIASTSILVNQLPQSWQIVGLGDLNGDGKTDILWQHGTVAGVTDQGQGELAVWLMNGGTIADAAVISGAVPSAWQVAGTADFSGDGKTDLLWHNSTTQEVAVWLLNGRSLLEAELAYGESFLTTNGQPSGAANDLILGDHGKIYVNPIYVDLLAQRGLNDYLSIATAITDGGGNDLIFGNQGDDTIVGGQGSDRIYGGIGEDDIIGGHNVIGGADSNDWVDGGANADVAIGDNGRITRRSNGNGGWQRYPAPFADVIRDVERFDDIELRLGLTNTVGDDTLRGGDGDDILHGQRGNDNLDGGAGDDELYGELGNDTMQGGSGQDTLLGDVGIISRAYNPDGTPRVNANGAWHRDVLLTDVSNLTATVGLDALASNLFATADILLLTQANGVNQVQILALYADGNDVMDGGSGDDALFGQRGNDIMQGGAGQDYLEGNAGDDQIAGGSGDDLIIGDNSDNLVAFKTEVPQVRHAYQVITQGAGLNFNLGAYGTIVTPIATLVPQVSFGLLPTLTLVPPATVNSPTTLLPKQFQRVGLSQGGTDFQPLLAMVPDLSHHLALLAGNDTLSGGAGDDQIVGDNYTSVVPLRTGVAAVDSAIDALTTTLYHLNYDVHDLEIALSNGQPAQELRIGNDTIAGDAGNDLVMADNATFYSPFVVQPPSNLAAVSNQVNTLRQAIGQLNNQVNTLIAPFTGAINSPYTLVMGNDTITGGDGNDKLLAADTLIFAPLVNSFDYRKGSFWNYGFDRTPQAVRPNFRDFNLTLDNNNVNGGTGNDLIVGGYSSLVLPLITKQPANATEQQALKTSLNVLSADIESFVRDLHNEKYGIDYVNRNQANTLNAENDVLSGGAGADLIVGDNATFVLPFLNNQVDLSINLAVGNFNLSEESHNFFDTLPHQFDFVYRNASKGNTTFGQDTISGDEGNDVLFGLQWRDRLLGGAGDDTLFGGREADILDGGSGSNLIRTTNPSPSDELAIKPFINSNLINLISPAMQRYLLEIIAAKDTLAPTGDLVTRT